MKIITYNLNGLRAANKLNVLEWLKKENADIIWNVDLSMNDLFKKNRKKMSHIDKLSLF